MTGGPGTSSLGGPATTPHYCYGVPYAGDSTLAYADAADNATAYVAYKPTDDATAIAADGEPIPADQAIGPLVRGPSTATVEGNAGGNDPFDFHTRAKTEFSQGDYRKATYFAAHAAVDEPRNQETHLLYSLGLFALGEYRGAAVESHAVASLGKLPDWKTVYAFYGDVEPYTSQLRKLEKFTRDAAKIAGRPFSARFSLHDDRPSEGGEGRPSCRAEVGAARSSGGQVANGGRRQGSARDRQAVGRRCRRSCRPSPHCPSRQHPQPPPKK